ncbi:Transport protein particle complex subunit [Spraguea lophii 42_110]|uniref:Transport protein particle complex subunit n=1 Tax=Spraguea lophii (strain 42_110) TaxID=1358809 RepID=S7WAF4_SPRLO|nr:Transport protein particle complex subunit [Spraguea lophii 42_110]
MSELLPYFISSIPKDNIESTLKDIGKEIGLKLLEIYQIENIHASISEALINITSNLLPKIYECRRSVEKSTEAENIYIIKEKNNIFFKNEIKEKFKCLDGIIAGIIEIALDAANYKCNVNSYIFENNYLYVIEQKDNNDKTIK